MKPNKLYVIDYYVNGVVKETINKDQPTNKFIANWKKSTLSKSTHKLGKLVLRPINP